MKIRNGFVSNSSSSSFVVFGDPSKAIEQLIDYGYNNPIENGYILEITDSDIKENIIDYIIIRHVDYHNKNIIVDSDANINNKLYITTYISDGNYLGDLQSCTGVYYYEDGNHGCPYSPEEHIKLAEHIWIDKEHLKKD